MNTIKALAAALVFALSITAAPAYSARPVKPGTKPSPTESVPSGNPNPSSAPAISKMDFHGTANLAVSGKGLYVHFGGPNVYTTLKNGMDVGLGFFPALRNFESAWSIALGLGPFVTYKNLVFSLPAFDTGGNTWYGAAGIGIQF